MAIDASRVLLLPGWRNSGPGHWQSRWEQLYGYQRVQQHDWERPLRGDWMMQLEEAVRQAQRSDLLLVAHSMGCLLVAAWAAHSTLSSQVAGALLVAPPDVEGLPDMAAVFHSWRSVPRLPLPFRSLLVGSRNDPYCAEPVARTLAAQWGSQYIDGGACGHINAESDLGDWPQGHSYVQALADEVSVAQ